MFKQAIALCFALVALSHAKEIESISDLSHCDRIPAQYRDLCASSIKAGYPFTFKVLESTPNKVEIEPVPFDQSNEWSQSPRGISGREVDTDGQHRAEARKAAALEDIADATKRTSYAISIIAAINVLGVIVGIIALTR